MLLRAGSCFLLVMLLVTVTALAVIRVAEWVRERDGRVPARLRAEALRRMKPPVRLIWGEADTVTPIAQGFRLARLFRAPITRLPGSGHDPHIEDPVHFLPALDAAIAEPIR